LCQYSPQFLGHTTLDRSVNPHQPRKAPTLPLSHLYVFSAKAPEDWRSPKAVANSEGPVRREASWPAPVLWRFLTGVMTLNTSDGRGGISPISFCLSLGWPRWPVVFSC